MKKKNRFIDIFLGIISIFAVVLFAISVSAFIPCFFKGFYTPWIQWLDIPNQSGYSYEQIKYAYSNILDFIWRGAEFNPGIAMSESGIDHFRDCIPLFWMQLWFLLGSAIFLIIYFVLIKLGKINKVKLFKIPLFCYGGMLTLVLLITIGVFAAIDFDSLFLLFHKVFFPGKDNWQFDPRFDRVILILPENYFLVCAVFIVSMAVIISILFVVCGLVSSQKQSKKEYIAKYWNSKLYISNIQVLSDTYIKKLSKKQRRKVLSYQNPNDRKLSLLARKKENEHLKGLKISISESNKPLLKGPIQYNLSHKGDYVVIGLSSSQIGVDIEKEKALEQNFVDFAFSKAEIRNMEILNISPLKMWTIKEALLKCLGQGIVKKPNSEELIIKNNKSVIYNSQTYYFKSFDYQGYVVSVVLLEDKLPNELIYE